MPKCSFLVSIFNFNQPILYQDDVIIKDQNMLNKVMLMGRLAKDPVLKDFSNNSIANLRVITSRSWKDAQTGEFKEKSEGHNISIQSTAIAKRISETLKKGDMIYAEGAMETRKWTDGQGIDRYMTEVVIRPYQGTLRRIPGYYNNDQKQTKPAQTIPEQIQPPQEEPISIDDSPSSESTEIDFFADMSLGNDLFDTFS